MTSTTTAFLAVSQNLSRYQAMTAAEPAVKTATAYYEANIGSVKSISDLVGNYRLLSYALNAYGLGDQINAKGLITKVLEGGVSNPKSLANTLPNSQWKAFAAAFNFVDSGATSPFIDQRGCRRRRATMSSSSWRAIRATRTSASSLRSISSASRRRSPANTEFSPIPIFWKWRRRSWGSRRQPRADVQPQTLSELMPLSDLKDPAKLTQLTERFTAMYDYTYGPSSGATSASRSIRAIRAREQSGAASVLASVISSNGSVLGSALNDFTGRVTANLLDRADVEHVAG